jgi:hypothetical protein
VLFLGLRINVLSPKSIWRGETKLRYYENTNPNNEVVAIHIADIHFGSIDPIQTYTILEEQFLQPISRIKFDILSIDGDLFDKKFLANNMAITLGVEFINRCARLCKERQATLVLLSGTASHDANQLSLFYGLRQDMELDVRIIESIRFEIIKGLKILCIPEEYGKPIEYYTTFLSERYDQVFLHGTIVNSVYGANKRMLGSKRAPVFDLECFNGCRGPIIAGHVHKAMCLDGYMYYVSNPIRYRFGEEEEKGYAIVLSSNQGHYYKFMPIESFRYDTVNINDIVYNDPNVVTAYLDNLLACGIDHVRIDFSKRNDPNTQAIVEKYYATNPNVVVKRYKADTEQSMYQQDESTIDKYREMDFLLDSSMDGYTKFVNFVNHCEGKTILTVQQLKDIISGKDFSGIF